ncbi:MAG: DNA alkylation repair protein [Symploca sp. SIO1B1]|nr:DNA alkylation repair protein [Symploca sp. SIO1B1]
MDVNDAHNYLEKLTVLLKSYGEPRRAAAAQKDKNSKFTFLAIRVPVLRSVALKEFSLDNFNENERLLIYNYIWNTTRIYEVMSIPLLYYRSKGLGICEEWFMTIRHWIDRLDNWGHCDDLAVIYSYFCHNYCDIVLPHLRELNESDDLWRIRASIVALAHYTGKGAAYLSPAEVLPFLDQHLGHKNKYVANAVGWILREYNKRYPSEIRSYIDNNQDNISRVVRKRAGV